MTTGKTIDLTRQTFVGNVMSLLFNILFRFVKTFLSRSKCLLISWLQSPSALICSPIKYNLSLFPLFPSGMNLSKLCNLSKHYFIFCKIRKIITIWQDWLLGLKDVINAITQYLKDSKISKKLKIAHG